MSSRVATVLSAMRHRLAAEHGGFLIEVVVSAAILLTAGAGVLAAMDGATNQTAQQRQQAVASNVAQAEMENVRAQKFASLVNIDVTRPPVTIDGTSYTVRTQTSWELQGTPAAAGCTSNARNPEALRVTTTVTWPRMRRAPAVLQSLIAAPAGSGAQRGAFLVQITNRDGTGISGIPVTLNGTSGGTSSVTGPTDAYGCVRFADLVPGNYDVEFAPAGYIRPNGDTSVDDPVSVVAGQTRNASYEIDRPGTAQIRFQFDNGPGLVTSKPPLAVTLTNSGISPAVKLLNVTPGQNFDAATGVFTTGALYPFTGSWGAYADNCSAASPSGAGQPLTLTVGPGASLGSPPLTMQLPGLDIRPRNAQTSGPQDQVYVRTACGNVYGPEPITSVTISGTTANRVVDGYPYGTVDVCAVRPQNGSNPRRWVRRTGVSNTSFGTPTQVTSTGSGNFDLNSGYSTTSPACGGWLP